MRRDEHTTTTDDVIAHLGRRVGKLRKRVTTMNARLNDVHGLLIKAQRAHANVNEQLHDANGRNARQAEQIRQAQRQRDEADAQLKELKDVLLVVREEAETHERLIDQQEQALQLVSGERDDLARQLRNMTMDRDRWKNAEDEAMQKLGALDGGANTRNVPFRSTGAGLTSEQICQLKANRGDHMTVVSPYLRGDWTVAGTYRPETGNGYPDSAVARLRPAWGPAPGSFEIVAPLADLQLDDGRL